GLRSSQRRAAALMGLTGKEAAFGRLRTGGGKGYALAAGDYILFAGANVQEEVGLRGARTSAHMIRPDFFIAVDCSPCADTFEKSEVGGTLGKGFMIRFYDPRCIMHRGVARFVEETARKHQIPFQYYKSLGGTDAAEVQLANDGVLVCTIGMPARYIHSTTSMIHIDDYHAVKNIILALISEIDLHKIAEIKHNG
ncbi:MAG: hypothetical protein PHO96_04760, partial [Candidatus Izemoplasmatales bacterium]|nr:hypothetical protein [Candidatus Izemoplasmatales bacterium]